MGGIKRIRGKEVGEDLYSCLEQVFQCLTLPEATPRIPLQSVSERWTECI